MQPADCSQGRGIVEWCQGTESFEVLQHAGIDGRWCGEAFAAMHDAVADAGDPGPPGLQLWLQPLLQLLVQSTVLDFQSIRRLRVERQLVLPQPFRACARVWGRPAGRAAGEQSRLEARAAHVEHQGQPVSHGGRIGSVQSSRLQVIVTGNGSARQIRSAYSRIERSEEKKPLRALLSSDMRFQAPRSAQAWLTRSWASR